MLDKRATGPKGSKSERDPDRLEDASDFNSQYAEIEASGLFDSEFYLDTNPDVASAGIDPLDHYVRWGRHEGRKPSRDFDPSSYLKTNPDLGSTIDPFMHYVRRGHTTGRPRSPLESFGRKIGLGVKDIQTILEESSVDAFLLSATSDREFWGHYARIQESGLFDADFYGRAVPVLKGDLDPLAHYMVWGYRSFVDPSPNFSSAEYCALNPDIRKAGVNPLLHYLLHGKQEKRQISSHEREITRARIDRFSVGLTPEEAIAMECLRGTAFLFRYGFTLEKSSSLEYAEQAVSELAARSPLLAVDYRSPDATIIIPVYGLLPALLNCLDSLSAQASKFSAEILVVDDASPDDAGIGQISAIPWIRYSKQRRNKGFIGSCNSAASVARGQVLVFLNNDTRVLPGWLDELIEAFKLFPKAGLIGSKLINENGSLQEAGGIVWRDGAVWNYGRGEDPVRPEFSFARQVDYCSGASIAVSAEAWSRVGGFDASYAPAYCEDTDLAFKLRRAGYETWLQPLSMVLHYEGRSYGREVGNNVKAYQVRNLKTFYGRWRGVLAEHGLPQAVVRLDANRTRPRRVLVLDAQTPTPDRDSGSVNADQLIRLFLQMNWHVAFAPRNHFFAGEYTRALQRVGVEMLITPDIQNIRDIIEKRPEGYDLIFAFRYESLTDCYDELRKAYPTARIIFHDVDLHYLRLQRKAELLSDRAMRIHAETVHDQELELFAKADCSVVVTKAEKQVIESEIPVRNIVVYPYTIDVRRSECPFEDRHHLCFIGGYAHDPNVDAVVHFVREIWPLVKPKLPTETKFLIVGPDAPEAVRNLASEHVIVTGHVPDLESLLDGCRLSVIPLRYGAGIKGKLVRTLANGVPSVATTLAVEGMELEHERQVLVADIPKEFARAVVRLFHSRSLWYRLREAGYGFAEEHYSWKLGLETLNRIIDVADATWIARRIAARQKRLAEFFAGISPSGQE